MVCFTRLILNCHSEKDFMANMVMIQEVLGNLMVRWQLLYGKYEKIISFIVILSLCVIPQGLRYYFAETIEEKESHFHYLYEDDLSIQEKIETIAKEIYGAGEVIFEPAALQQMKRIEELGFGKFPVCMAKNQYSLSDDKSVLGRPEGFPILIREIYVSAGAGFVVAITGTIMTMPGLPKVPAAEGIDVGEDGQITGLF